MGPLLRDMSFYFNQSIAPNTHCTYRSGFNSYSRFCLTISSSPFPVSERNLQLYVTSIARQLSFKTIKIYLSAVRYYSLMRGHACDFNVMHQLHYLLRGIRRSQGNSFTRPRRQPITVLQISTLFCRISQLHNNRDTLMLQSEVSLAFFGLLRDSEYTSNNSHTYIQEESLCIEDISIAPNRNIAAIHIKASKTDPFRAGCTIRIGASNTSICPIRSLLLYINIHPMTGPLYQFANGSFLTRSDIVQLLRCVFPFIPSINTHSFRIGGASAAATAGIADSAIQILGRWTSDAYRRYIHIADETVQQWSRQVAAVTTYSRTWDSDSLVSI